MFIQKQDVFVEHHAPVATSRSSGLGQCYNHIKGDFIRKDLTQGIYVPYISPIPYKIQQLEVYGQAHRQIDRPRIIWPHLCHFGDIKHV